MKKKAHEEAKGMLFSQERGWCIATTEKMNELKIKYKKLNANYNKLKEKLEKKKEGKHEHEHEEEETGYDEHVWLSLKNAEIFVKKLADVMAVKDEKNAEKYQRNAAIYNESLSELDAEYEKAVGEANVKTLVFADR